MEGLSNAELEGVSEADIETQRKMEEFAENMPFLDRETTLGLASQAAGVDLLEGDDDDAEAEGMASAEASGNPATSKNPRKTQPKERASQAQAHADGDITGERAVGERAQENVDAVRLQYQAIARDDTLYALSNAALQNELQAYKTLHDVNVAMLNTFGCSILLSTHADILDAVLHADVAARYIRKPAFRGLLDRIRVHVDSTEHPSVYLNQIAGVRGQAPTANELLTIVQRLFKYVEGTDAIYIAQIDRVHATSRTKEPVTRKYMASTNGISSVRQNKMRAFLAALRTRCLAIAAADRDKPMPGWLAEFGYTHTTETRLKNHRAHVSSNYIMNLVDSALNLEYPQKYSVHQFVVFACSSPMDAIIAEIIFTRIGLAYTGSGGGFTHYPVGLSNNSALWHASEEWADWSDWACITFDIEKNAAKEKGLWTLKSELIAKIEKIKAKITANPIPPYISKLLEGMSLEEKKELRSDLKQMLEDRDRETARKLAEIRLMRDAARSVVSANRNTKAGVSEDQQEQPTERKRLENEMARLRQKLKGE